jgi:hypothetical protein
MGAGPLRTAFVAGIAAVGAAGGVLAHSQEAPKEPIQLAQLEGSPQQVNFASAAQGKPVQFIYGSQVNDFTLQAVVENVQESGCPVTTRQLSNTDRIIVKVDGRTAGTEDPAFAGMFALKYCN